MSKSNHNIHRLSAAGLLITLGIIYGDIGTSPLYVMSAIIGKSVISERIVLGGLSCVFWTLTLQTTVKYVMLTLRADNRGEGGIFSLYALIRRRNPYMIWFAIIGGAMLLADGIITPPISITSAIEGLELRYHNIPTVEIVVTILILLFVMQSFGAKLVGNFFGPVMFIWFAMLAVLGVSMLSSNWGVLKAINPYYAWDMLQNYPGGFWILGSVFLCTTGAEALYSDLGHCGRENIRISWMFVKVCLLLNYFGQGAWLLKGQHLGHHLHGNPFFEMMPDWFLLYGVAIATCAAVIASQALISGSFTLVSEAIRMNLWPKVRIVYPTMQKGQLYVPSMNWLLLIGCLCIVWYFKEASKMEAAYGLAISLTMLMTTFLLSYWLYAIKKVQWYYVVFVLVGYLAIETGFLIANLEKFTNGGFVALIIGTVLALVMYVWFQARKIKNRLTEFVPMKDYHSWLNELSHDMSVPKYATHLVYLTSANSPTEIESKIIYSIFQKQPKRADIYWLLHIDTLDDPYTMEYKVNVLVPDDLIRVDFRLGFKVEHKINLFFRKVVEDLVKNKEVDFTSRYTSLNKRNIIGDFRFVVLEKHLSQENELGWKDKMVMSAYFVLKIFSLSETSAFGLDTSSVTVEKVPMVITPTSRFNLTRVK